jgi:hypothetical protein
MQPIIEQIKKIFAQYMPHTPVHFRAANGIRPRVDWLKVLVSFFVVLLCAGILAYVVYVRAEDASRVQAALPQTAAPTFDAKGLSRLEDYFNAKAAVLQTFKNGATSTPADPAK